MTRFARVAASAVLVALCIGAHASAAPLNGLGWGIARLEPARMFNPNAESLFAALTPATRSMSPIDVAVFNVDNAPDAQVALRDDESTFAPHGTGSANVNLAIAHVRAAYTASSPVQAPVPHLADVQLSAPANEPSRATLGAVAIRTAPPAVSAPQEQPAHFGSYVSYAPSPSVVDASVAVPGRLGKMHFDTAFHAMQVCGTADEGAACPSTSEATAAAQSMTAGADFNVRAGNSAVKVGLSSSIEHVNNATAAMFPYVPLDLDAQAGLSYFGLTDVVAQSVGAQVAVPVNRHLTVGLQYDRSNYQGDYGNALLPGFDASKDTYLGNVTYQLPNTSSAITLSARQYRYNDAFSPNYNLTQTRADLNFTVKF